MAINHERMFVDRDIYVIDQPGKEQGDNLCCVYSLGKFFANKHYITDRVGYDKLLFVFVEEGSMFLRFSGQEHKIYENEAFFIDCTKHQVYGTLGNSCNLLFVHFNGGACEYLYEQITADSGHVFLGYRARLIKSCIKEIAELSESHNRNKPHKYSQILTDALYGLLNYETESDPVFYNAAQTIRDGVAQNQALCVEDLAAQYGYSKFYFTKKFSETMGVAPYEFIIQERLSLAKKMLINTSMQVGEIALECGFFDASHMANCFKKREGMSPTAFRHEGKKTF